MTIFVWRRSYRRGCHKGDPLIPGFDQLNRLASEDQSMSISATATALQFPSLLFHAPAVIVLSVKKDRKDQKKPSQVQYGYCTTIAGNPPAMDALKQVYIYRLPKEILETLKPRSYHDALPQNTEDQEESSNDDDDGNEDDDEDIDDEVARANTGMSNVAISKTVEVIHSPTSGSPVSWYTSSILPHPSKIGLYKAMLPSRDTAVQDLQIEPHSEVDRTIAMFMVGGGHFQGTIISLRDSNIDRCFIKASKGFHRYTTRRKQGGAQSANDNAKGAANSAGAQIRRYNEIALAQDVRDLLKEWKTMLATVDIILIRASGPSSKKLLYENGIDKSDTRVRGFPLNTRRATQGEIIRSFHVLSRLQVGSTEDDVVETKPIQAKASASQPVAIEVKPDAKQVEYTEKLTTLIRRNKIPAFRAYMTEHALQINDFRLEPQKSHVHNPTLLHFASFSGTAPVISALLDLGADPRAVNDVGKTAFEIASSKEVRDAFRIWRGALGNEQRWDWESARIPAGLSPEQIKARKAKEAELKVLEEAEEDRRRKVETARLQQEAEDERAAAKSEENRRRGPGQSLAMGVLGNSSMTSLEGMTPEMRKKVERERRARAAEARFKK